MGVDRGPAGVVELGRCQEPGQFGTHAGEIVPFGVEGLRDRSPGGPGGQYLLLGRGGRPALRLQVAGEADRGEIGLDPGFGARRRQLLPGDRPEPYRLRDAQWCR